MSNGENNNDVKIPMVTKYAIGRQKDICDGFFRKVGTCKEQMGALWSYTKVRSRVLITGVVLVFGILVGLFYWADALHEVQAGEIKEIELDVREQNVRIEHIEEQMRIIQDMNRSLKNIERAITKQEE